MVIGPSLLSPSCSAALQFVGSVVCLGTICSLVGGLVLPKGHEFENQLGLKTQPKDSDAGKARTNENGAPHLHDAERARHKCKQQKRSRSNKQTNKQTNRTKIRKEV